MFKMKNIILLILLTLFAKYLFAQKDIKYIREGNKYYNEHKFQKSEISYRKAVEKKSDSYKAGFNLGDALYKQEKYEEAANQFKSLINYDLNKEDMAKAYHNLGNSLLQSKKYEESIDAYKSALRNNSQDDDTRYNLAYAQKMIKQQQNKKQENKQNNKDQKKDQKNQQQQEQKNKNEEKKNKQQQQISKEDAERLLKASQDNEKNVQKKLKEAKLIKGEKNSTEKDW
jgi:Ca-activated chloride channel homolog